MTDGDEAFERGDYEEAIVKYRAAYYGLTPAQRTSYIGSIPVRNAMRAYELLLAERQDRSALEQQLGFLTEFLESVRAQDGGVTRVGEAEFAQLEDTRTEVEKKLAALAQVVAPPADPEQEPPPEDGDEAPEVDLEGGPIQASNDWIEPAPRRNWLGIGLAIGGGTTVGIGAGVKGRGDDRHRRQGAQPDRDSRSRSGIVCAEARQDGGVRSRARDSGDAGDR